MRLIAPLVVAALGLTACGDDGSDRGAGRREVATEPAADTMPASDETAGPASEVEVLEAAFAQGLGYLSGVAIVTTDDEDAVGQFVTVTMDFLDENGEVVHAAEQVESFSWPGQELVLPIVGEQVSDPVAGVDVVATLTDHGVEMPPMAPLPTIDATDVSTEVFEDTITATAVFELTNSTDADLENPRVGVVCRDSAGTLVGGSGVYPSTIRAGQAARLEPSLWVSAEPEVCTAYPTYGTF